MRNNNDITQTIGDYTQWSLEQVSKWALKLEFGVEIENFLRENRLTGKFLDKLSLEKLVQVYKLPGALAETLMDAIKALKPDSQNSQLSKLNLFWKSLGTTEPNKVIVDNSIILKFSHSWFNVESILVRECYDHFEKLIVSYHSDKTKIGLNITGDPGIGKSTFFPYFLYMTRNKPFYSYILHSIHYDGRILIFTYHENKPVVHVADIIPTNLDVNSTIYFVDGVKPFLGQPFFTVLISCFSDEPTFKQFRKPLGEISKSEVVIKYMPEWTWNEIMSISNFFKMDISAVESRYSKWGGNVMYVLQQTFQQNILDESFSKVDLIELLKTPLKNETILSHKLLHYKITENYDLYGMGFASPYVAQKVFQSIKRETLMISLSEYFTNPETFKSPIFANLYELWVLERIRVGGTFTITNKITLKTEDLVITNGFPIYFHDYNKFLDIKKSNTLYIPKRKSSDLIDCIYTPNILFQCTISNNHRVLPSKPITKIIEQLNKMFGKAEEIKLIAICPNVVNFTNRIYYSDIGSDTEMSKWKQDFLSSDSYQQLSDKQKEYYQIILLEKNEYLNFKTKDISNSKKKHERCKKLGEDYDVNLQQANQSLESLKLFQDYINSLFEKKYKISQYVLPMSPPRSY